MKKVLANYSSKNDINIKQIVAYKDHVLEMEEYRDGFQKENTMNVMSVILPLTAPSPSWTGAISSPRAGAAATNWW